MTGNKNVQSIDTHKYFQTYKKVNLKISSARRISSNCSYFLNNELGLSLENKKKNTRDSKFGLMECLSENKEKITGTYFTPEASA